MTVLIAILIGVLCGVYVGFMWGLCGNKKVLYKVIGFMWGLLNVPLKHHKNR